MVLRSLLVFLFMMSVVLTGAQEIDKSSPKFQVDVEVSCDNSVLASEIESYLNRELRSLGDVEIVDNRFNEYYLSLLVIENSYESGQKTGEVTIAILGLLSIDRKKIFALQKNYDIPAEVFADATFDAVFGYRNDCHFRLMTRSLQNIKLTCEQIVAGFDTEMIEPERQKR